jgi:hypothetical protein
MRSAKKAAEEAIEAIGLGYDLGFDLRLKYCKKNSPRLIGINDDGKQVHNMVIPGGFSIPNVPKSIKCDKGERLRFSSDVLSFQQVKRTHLSFVLFAHVAVHLCSILKSYVQVSVLLCLCILSL